MEVSILNATTHQYEKIFEGKMLLVVDNSGTKGIIGGELGGNQHVMISFTQEEREKINDMVK